MMKEKSVGFGFQFQTPRPISFILWVSCCFLMSSLEAGHWELQCQQEW